MRPSVSVWSFAVLALALTVSQEALAQGKAEAKAPPPPQISKAVRKPLVAAQKAATEQKWPECIANADAANAIPEKTPYDIYVISDIIGFCKIRSNDLEGAMAAFEVVAKSEFADAARRAQISKAIQQIAFNVKQYPKAIEYGTLLIDAGGADEGTYLRVAQAHYVQNNYKATREFTEGWIRSLESQGAVPPSIAIELWVSSCVRLEDDACLLASLESQATHHPKEQTWPNLVQILFRGAPVNSTLDLLRLAREAGALRRGDEYTEMAQLALERGLPGEAQSVLEQGIAAGMFANPSSAELSKRLLASAKTQATADRPILVKQEKESAANKNGQVDVRIGQAFLSYGQYAEAIAAIERGLAKGNVRNVPDARLSLGIAQLRAGQKDAAAATFKTVEGDELMRRIARLWGLRAR